MWIHRISGLINIVVTIVMALLALRKVMWKP
jgi:hypothetical protein